VSAPEIKRFVVRQFADDVAVDDLADDFDLLDNGVVDSLGLLRLIAWLGDRYSIPVDDIDIEPDDFRTVDAMAAFVARHRAVPAAG